MGAAASARAEVVTAADLNLTPPDEEVERGYGTGLFSGACPILSLAIHPLPSLPVLRSQLLSCSEDDPLSDVDWSSFHSSPNPLGSCGGPPELYPLLGWDP